jgi:hypothetical protein
VRACIILVFEARLLQFPASAGRFLFLHVAIKRLKQRKVDAMTQAELFSPTETVSTEVKAPSAIADAMTAGHDNPKAANPFLWSSTLWEAFQIGQYLHSRGINPPFTAFRKVSGSIYANPRADLSVKVIYDRRGGTMSHALIANR